MFHLNPDLCVQHCCVTKSPPGSAQQFSSAAQRSPVRCCAVLCGTVLCCAVLGAVLYLLFRTCQIKFEESCQVPVHQVCTYYIIDESQKCTPSSAQVSSSSVAQRSAVRCRALRCDAVPCCPGLRCDFSRTYSTRYNAKYQVPLSTCVLVFSFLN